MKNKTEINELIVIKQLPIIEEKLKGLSLEIEKDVEEALKLEVNEETIKDVKSIRSKLTKDFKELEEQRKFVKETVLAPYLAFEDVYKIYVSEKYKLADETLKTRVDEVEDKLKAEKEEQVIEYFNELIAKEKIDFVAYEQLGIKVGLSNSLKSLKEGVKNFVEKVIDDLKLIETQEFKTEILVEYKQSLNVANAITSVSARMKAIEEAKKQEEIRLQQKQEEIKVIEKVEGFTAPVEVVKEVKEEIKTMTFKVFGTITELKKVKEYLESEGIKYE